MAKATGSRRIVVPDTKSPSASFSGHGGGVNGSHEELAQNLAEALKLNRTLEGVDGSELTPRSRASWASQVEEEHDEMGWSGVPNAGGGKEGYSAREPLPPLPAEEDAADADDGLKKSRKKKPKKKKGGKAPLPSTVGGMEGGPIIATQKSDDQLLPSCNSPGSAAANSRNAEAAAGIGGRSRGSNNNAVWALKRTDSARQVDDKKAGLGASGSALPPPGMLSPQQAAAADAAYGDATLPKHGNEGGGDSGWDDVGDSSEWGGGGSSGGTGAGGGASNESWGVVSSQADNEDSSGWKVSGSRRNNQRFAAAAPAELSPDVDSAGAAAGSELSSNWDSGWEVAGSRRSKKADDSSSFRSSSSSSFGGGQGGQKGNKGGGRNNNININQIQSNPGSRPRSAEWEKLGGKGRGSPGYTNVQEKVARPSPRSSVGPSNFATAAGAARQAPTTTQSGWGKPLNRAPSYNDNSNYSSSNSSSNWDSQPLPRAPSSGASTGSTFSANTGNILGQLLPQAGPSPPPPPPVPAPAPAGVASSTINLGAWKGGFPPFSGNGASVFDDYSASVLSDSQCSDEDFDSDSMSLASFDSEDSQKSHSTQRMNKWFRNFFQELDVLTEQQLIEHDRQWHCPACQGGVGAIEWYRGLQPLLAHAKTVRSKRVKLHKAFAEVLEEEIRIRGAVPGTHGSGKYGKWRGLGDDNENLYIVWPPMVVIRNTQLQKDEDDKWIGMGNKELLDLFKKHNPVKARHAYGPQGHRGISILIFAESPTGYYNAQRLEKQFIEARRGKSNWEAPGKLLFQPGGNRILYGYMATKEDLDFFNKHSKGKQNLKWELKSFQEVVLLPMRKLDEENNKLSMLQSKVQREIENTKILKKTMFDITKKLVMREEELQVIRGRAKEQHQQQQTEMEDMETLYKEKIDQLKNEIEEKEDSVERIHMEYEQEHMQQCEMLEQQASKMPKGRALSDEQQRQQASVEEQIARHSKLAEMCIRNQELWGAKKVELLREHHQKMMDFKVRQWEELINFEKQLDREREEIMEAYRFPTGEQGLEA